MGLHFYAYLGPYVEAKYRNTSVEIDVYGCTDASCIEYSNRSQAKSKAKFCPHCGKETGGSKLAHVAKLGTFEVIGEALSTVNSESEGLFYLVPNRKTKEPYPRNFQPECGDESHEDLTKINQANEIAWLERNFSTELKALKAEYDDVTVKWGLHVYYM